MGFSFPVTPSNGVSPKCSAPDDFQFPETDGLLPEFAFVVAPDTGFGAATPGVDTGVVTPPAQEETEIFFASWIQGSQPLYHAVPINAARILLSRTSRSIPARKPGVNWPRARKDRLRFGTGTWKSNAGLGNDAKFAGATRLGFVSPSIGNASAVSSAQATFSV